MALGAGLFLFAIIAGLGLLYFYMFPRSQTNLRSLMSGAYGGNLSSGGGSSRGQSDEEMDEELQRIKNITRKRGKKKQKITLEERFFRAGIFSDQERKEFNRMRIFFPIFLGPIAAFFTWGLGAEIALVAIMLGVLLGLQAPFTLLDRKIQRRGDDIMFYLPLVIEQIAIGVSSSLDIGPCLQRVVSMAEERDSHNVVSELVRHAQFHVKSGISLEEALNEVGRLSGHTELKHAFMSLAQVAKHGGEITRQLQELADAVGMQRDTKIEGKIKKLELEATGPVGLVFCGFLTILLVGFGIQVLKAFG